MPGMALYLEVTDAGVIGAGAAAEDLGGDGLAVGEVHGDAGEDGALVEGELEAAPVVGVTDDAEEGGLAEEVGDDVVEAEDGVEADVGERLGGEGEEHAGLGAVGDLGADEVPGGAGLEEAGALDLEGAGGLGGAEAGRAPDDEGDGGVVGADVLNLDPGASQTSSLAR